VEARDGIERDAARAVRRRPLRTPTLVVAVAALFLAAAAAQTAARHRRGAAPAIATIAGGRLAPGSRPSALPGDVLIADRANDRLLIVSPRGRIVWEFPRPGELARGQTFLVPDDAFFSLDGREIVATQEDDFVISVISLERRRIVFRYGHPGVAGSQPGYLDNPDDAILTSTGAIIAADIKNCRLVEIRPPVTRHLARQLGRTGDCLHDPPARFSSPNGAFPAAGRRVVVTEIGGDWVDLIDHAGRLVTAIHAPGLTYPSDTNQLRPGVLLSVDYTFPGAVETFTTRGRLLWRYAPAAGPGELDHPSLALPLPNGDVLVNDDYDDRVIVLDPRTDRIVWQYGHRGVPGAAAGYLDIPDGVDLAPPFAFVDRFPRLAPPR